jgi:hypothetical protein
MGGRRHDLSGRTLLDVGSPRSFRRLDAIGSEQDDAAAVADRHSAFADKDDAEITLAGFQRDGFHGPLNIYRGMQPYFDQAKAFAGKKIEQPAASSFSARGRHDQDAGGLKKEDLTALAQPQGLLAHRGHWSLAAA